MKTTISLLGYFVVCFLITYTTTSAFVHLLPANMAIYATLLSLVVYGFLLGAFLGWRTVLERRKTG